MDWNYRIIMEDGDIYRLVEVSYNKHGKPVGYNDVFTHCDVDEGPKTLRRVLRQMLKDTKDKPVLVARNGGFE